MIAALATAGYALAQLRVPGGKAIYALLLAGLTRPFEALITPLYYDIQSMNLLGSRLAIILPLIGLLMPFGVFWMRAHFLNAEVSLQREQCGEEKNLLAGLDAGGAGAAAVDEPVSSARPRRGDSPYYGA
jgi:hypothetical protein